MGQPSPPFIEQYDVGDLVHAVASFVGTDGVTPATPSMVAFFTLNPLGSVGTHIYGQAGASVLLVGSAAYAHDFTVDVAGSWFYRWVATGVVQAADEWGLIVAQSRFVL